MADGFEPATLTLQIQIDEPKQLFLFHSSFFSVSLLGCGILGLLFWFYQKKLKESKL